MGIWNKDKQIFEDFLVKDEDVMYFNNTTEEFQNATIDEFQTEALNIYSSQEVPIQVER
jgi:hypothetical protein